MNTRQTSSLRPLHLQLQLHTSTLGRYTNHAGFERAIHIGPTMKAMLFAEHSVSDVESGGKHRRVPSPRCHLRKARGIHALMIIMMHAKLRWGTLVLRPTRSHLSAKDKGDNVLRVTLAGIWWSVGRSATNA